MRSPNELVTDIIDRAGGLLPNAYPRGSSFTRNGEKINLSFEKIIRFPSSRDNFEMVEGDIIDIGPRPNVIRVEGEVNSPGTYQYFPGSRLSDYVDFSGGYTKDASRLATYIKYPDGSSKNLAILNFTYSI